MNPPLLLLLLLLLLLRVLLVSLSVHSPSSNDKIVKERRGNLLQLVDPIAEVFVLVIDSVGPMTNSWAVDVTAAR